MSGQSCKNNCISNLSFPVILFWPCFIIFFTVFNQILWIADFLSYNGPAFFTHTIKSWDACDSWNCNSGHFQFCVKSNRGLPFCLFVWFFGLIFFFRTLCDWTRKPLPPNQLITYKTKNAYFSVTFIFPLFIKFGCFFCDFSSHPCEIFPSYVWLWRLQLFWVYIT